MLGVSMAAARAAAGALHMPLYAYLGGTNAKVNVWKHKRGGIDLHADFSLQHIPFSIF